jgi:hypothetical protein
LVGEHVQAIQRDERLGEREGEEAIVTLSAVVGKREQIWRQGKK